MSKRNLLLFVAVMLLAVSVFPSEGAKFKNPPVKSAISDEDFVRLCRFGTAEEVRQAIRSNAANVNAKGTISLEVGGRKYDNKVSALMAACAGNNADTVRTLIQADADIKTRVDLLLMQFETISISDRADVLCFASAFSKNPDIVSMLIKAGADVNSKMEDGMTPLIWATQERNNPAIVKTLIRAGANVNDKTKNGMTALHFAVGTNEGLEIVKMLLRAGAEINAKSYMDRTVLMHASWLSNNPEIVDIIIKAGADVNAKDENGETALMYAASWPNNTPEIIDMLIRAGADDLINDKGKSALMIAVESSDNPEIVKALIEAGSFVNFKDRDGNTPLKQALARPNSEAKTQIINLLVKAGATD